MVKRRKKKRLKKSVVVFIIFVTAFIVVVNKDRVINIVDMLSSLDESKKIEIINEDSNSRPIAVMINNQNTARKYQTGLQDAYIIYEIIVEGGLTRYMALFKDQDLSRIGSVRSSRHYFIDYVLENDAIYVHWGWSPEAENDIDKYGVDNINGLSHEQYYFYRDNTLDISYEHRGFTNSELISKAIDKIGYRKNTDVDNLFEYSSDDVLLNEIENSLVANEIYIPYSKSVETSYIYDKEKEVYYRFVNGEEHKDYVSEKQYHFTNIITYQVSNSTLSGDVKGRQEIDNIGSGNGYYISKGYAVPITWEKKNRSSQTVYKYLNGTEIKVNDGNTFIQIQPSSKKLLIK